MEERGWTPVRRGKVYCSPLCGHNCTWADYRAAKTRANKLAKKLGLGWEGVVWDNLGWHFKVTHLLPGGRLDVHEENDGRYTCYLNADRVQYIGEGRTAEASVRHCVRKGHEHLQYIAGLVVPAHAVATKVLL